MELYLTLAVLHMIGAYAVMAFFFSERNVYHGWESFLLPLIWELIPVILLFMWPIRIYVRHKRQKEKEYWNSLFTENPKD